MRLYSCMIWDDQKVKRDLVPCSEKGGLRRAGLWDRVEGKFYPNAMANGTDFVRGPRIKLPWQRVGFTLLFR